MMAWLAFHRGVQLIEEAGLPANDELERWKKVRDQIHREVCERGYNPKVKAFTQYYGSDALDASLLMMPMVGFLPIEDERVRNTIAAIERDLLHGVYLHNARSGYERIASHLTQAQIAAAKRFARDRTRRRLKDAANPGSQKKYPDGGHSR
jgi:GH15 family glucan-1,4-alpha-glucosidase